MHWDILVHSRPEWEEKYYYCKKKYTKINSKIKNLFGKAGGWIYLQNVPC